MVLGILIAAITAPGLLGSQEAIRQGQSKDKREEHRARRCNLIATCIKSSPRSGDINDRPIVLYNGKLWIGTTTDDGEPFGHMCAGYYLPYPDTKYEGLVTTITDAAPIMNWVYIDRDTHEAKYGVRADAQSNLTGPFDCTRQDRRLTFEGWEGWCAVEEYEGYWCLYFDVNDDGLRSKVAPGTRVLEIELTRKEKRFKKEQDARQQDQTTTRATNTQEDAPVDRPLQPTLETKKPGAFNEARQKPKSIAIDDVAPKTPPPGYSKTERGVAPPTLDRMKRGAVDALDNLLAMESQANAANKSSSLQQRSKSSQLDTSPNEKRITPKLNRNSGSKALAQAQMFEAMAAAQNNNDTMKRTSLSKRESASSFADSVSVYSEEDQRLSQQIRPQSSVSQRIFYQQPIAPEVTRARQPEPRSQMNTMTEPQRFVAPLVQKDKQPPDPAVFAAAPSVNNKRGQASNPSQRRRNSKVLTARRPGKRVSPRTSARKSLTDTASSSTGRQRLNASGSAAMQGGRSKAAEKPQRGRKTTSTVLRDLDDLVRQE